jgi:hypothetical protein
VYDLYRQSHPTISAPTFFAMRQVVAQTRPARRYRSSGAPGPTLSTMSW